MKWTRRNLLGTSGLVMAAAASLGLAGCVTTTTGTTTTVTLDVKKIQAYGTAGLNAARTAVAVLGAAGTLSAFVVPFNALADTLQADLDAFATGVGAQTTIVYDDSSVKALVNSVFTDIQQILTLVNSVIASGSAQAAVPASVLSKVTIVSTALQTIVSVFAALIDTVLPTASNGGGMTEAQALKTLGA